MPNLRINPKEKLTKEPLLAQAVDVAREALNDVTSLKNVGEHAGLVQEGDRVVTHAFVCLMPGYRGWYWTVTLARAARSKSVTVDEVSLRPGMDALLAPEWVPWADRLRPGDIGATDRLPYNPDDPHLVSVNSEAEADALAAAGEISAGSAGFAASASSTAEASFDMPSVAAAVSPSADDGEGASNGAAGSGDVAGDAAGDAADGGRVASGVTSPQYDAPQFDPDLKQGYESADCDADRAAQWELGLGRARVLSESGRADAFRRWYRGEGGPRNQATREAKAQCSSCGYFMKMAGSARLLFGVCANMWSPFDGRVVSVDHGCGAHSETDVKRRERLWVQSEPVIDEADLEVVSRSGAEKA
ncbi:MAG: DUF3027 domain-containing protein [Actinomycetaceae bacterium]|nr:DUF3027 domain-containing protein [Actinomycetaceae bacterium]MDY5273120.1 DUF3027 domain-containing protein [Arcanobacterium sp.]